MNYYKTYALPILVVLITFVSVNQWNKIQVGNTFVVLGLAFITVFITIWYKRLYFHPENRRGYYFVSIYFVWLIIGVIRGIFVADNYWEWKQFVYGTMALSLPVFVFVFSVPEILANVLRMWIRYALPAFFLFFFWTVSTNAYAYFLGPIFLLGCFIPIVGKKWQFLFIALLVLMLLVDFTARSQVIKSAMVLLLSIGYVAGKYLSRKVFKILHWIFYLAPVILLYLGISGTFNIFEGLSSHKGKYIEKQQEGSKLVEEDLAGDTRTFIYSEVISSAIRHNYIIWGRTPARGNDSAWFGAYQAKVLGTGKYERYENEVCFPNVFTWLGLIGMLLYIFIYLKSSYLAVYKSNSIIMKLLGVFIAFRFMYGWIEDFNRFDIMNISLWMMIAMGFSEQFRKMNDIEFKTWVQTIFVKKQTLIRFIYSINQSSDENKNSQIPVVKPTK